MNAGNATLEAILHSPNQYVIPIFQRFYSWKKENWEKLWEDLQDLHKDGNRNHFMGPLVFLQGTEQLPTNVRSYIVIDGQQRLITLSLLLCGLRDHAISKGYDAIAGEIRDNFLTNQYRKGQEHFRILPRRRDRTVYTDIVDQRASETGYGEGNLALAQAFRFLAEKVASVDYLSTAEGVRSFFDSLRVRLEFVLITLDKENPYRIFKSLNSTGVDLTQADLVRNFVFMHLPLSEVDAFDDEHWERLEKNFEEDSGKFDANKFSEFLRHFLMFESGNYVGANSIFEAFESRYQEPFNPIDLAKEIERQINFYDIIRGRKTHPNNDLQDVLVKLNKLPSTTAYPLVLNLMNRWDRDEMTVNDLIQAINLLSGFILRRYVCSESSRTYGKWFVQACGACSNPAIGASVIERLQNFLKDKGFPDSERFSEAFVSFNAYEGNYQRTILIALEESIPHKERADLSKASIEHIMPQTLTEQWKLDIGREECDRIHSKWLHTIGNLTLTAYNSELGAKPFVDKRIEYLKSNIQLTRQVVELDTWGEQQIVSRGRTLAQRACGVWIGLDN